MPRPKDFDSSAAYETALNNWIKGRGIAAAIAELIRETEWLDYQLRSKAEAETEASFDAVTGSVEFQVVHTETGSFLATLERTEPYLDGFKLHFKIASLGTPTYSGFTLTARWGPLEWSRYIKEVQHKEQTYAQSIFPSKWNDVELLLPSTKADQIKRLSLGIKTNTVSFPIR